MPRDHEEEARNHNIKCLALYFQIFVGHIVYFLIQQRFDDNENNSYLQHIYVGSMGGREVGDSWEVLGSGIRQFEHAADSAQCPMRVS
jgi:hypothetical protein